MKPRDLSIFGAMVFVAAAAGPSSATAQTFQNYRCADGTQFIVGFFDYDKRAYLQIDGGPVGRRDAVDHQGRHHGQACEAAGNGLRTDISKRAETFSFRPLSGI
ncbi:lysozyme inhibitor [Bradyrhizobium sp.]|jgi:hypothetical protein|uniref:lysozyme inhibitor n=1 Tax=Bradyrhizobium sp. TaxID=376 RepID=UPI0039C86639